MLHEEVLLYAPDRSAGALCHARRLSSLDGDDRASPLNEALKRKSPGHRPGPSQMRYTARLISRELSFRSRRGSLREPARLRPASRCR